jgi:hypothetical protein
MILNELCDSIIKKLLHRHFKLINPQDSPLDKILNRVHLGALQLSG